MQLPWYVFAIGSAAAWGVHYPLSGIVLTRMSPAAVLVLIQLPALALLPFCFGSLADGVRGAFRDSTQQGLLLLALPLTAIVAHALLLTAIRSKNAALASLVELSYPLFVVLFSTLFFRQAPPSGRVLIGGGLVVVGVALITLGGARGEATPAASSSAPVR